MDVLISQEENTISDGEPKKLCESSNPHTKTQKEYNMRSNITTIRFTAKLSIIFALFTYIVTLNIETAFFSPNWTWISNNFALTVCGGVFASTLVVMFCEIQKYLENKTGCEQYLFYQTVYLYSSLFQIQKNVEEFINNPVEPIAEGLLEKNTQMARYQINAIRSVDYVTFSKKNSLMRVYNSFCSGKLIEIETSLLYDNYLRRAVTTTKINNLKLYGQQGTVTSADSLVNRTLAVINEKCLHFLNDLSGYLEEIDQSCNNRFKWNEVKEKIHENYISIFVADQFENFLAQNGK